jgi:predicted dehydrogenase
VFRYSADVDDSRSQILTPASRGETDRLGIAFVGAGSYAKAILLPAVGRARDADRVSIVTATGPSARATAQKHGFARCSTDPASVFDDPEVGLIFVATRNDSHADLAGRALRAGKAVWLEKPIGIHPAEVDALLETARDTGGFLAVGYNRRFSPHARAIRETFEGSGPISIRYTVAAGPTPGGTWHTDPDVGGGRIVEEVCHFVDLCAYLVGGPPTTVFARALGRNPETDDSVVALLGFEDGSTAAIEYLANTSRELSKERFEVSGGGRTAYCDNYRATTQSGRKPLKTLNQDKGQAAAVAEIIATVRRGDASPFGLEELAGVSHATFAIRESVRTGQAVTLDRNPGVAARS